MSVRYFITFRFKIARISILRLYHNAFLEIQSKYHWNENSDVRIAHLKVCAETILQYLLSGIFLKDQLTTEKWWKDNFRIDTESASIIIPNKLTLFDQHLKETIFLKSILDMEWFFIVIFLKTTGQTFISKEIDNTQLIFKSIDDLKLSSDFKKFVKVLSNLKHAYFNGGFYRNDDEDIEFDGKEFLFTKDFPIPAEYSSWELIEFFLMAMKDLYILL